MDHRQESGICLFWLVLFYDVLFKGFVESFFEQKIKPRLW